MAGPKLGPLQYNGGLTQTMALMADSPAIDKECAALGDPGDEPHSASEGQLGLQRGAQPGHRGLRGQLVLPW